MVLLTEHVHHWRRFYQIASIYTTVADSTKNSNSAWMLCFCLKDHTQCKYRVVQQCQQTPLEAMLNKWQMGLGGQTLHSLPGLGNSEACSWPQWVLNVHSDHLLWTLFSLAWLGWLLEDCNQDNSLWSFTNQKTVTFPLAYNDGVWS